MRWGRARAASDIGRASAELSASLVIDDVDEERGVDLRHLRTNCDVVKRLIVRPLWRPPCLSTALSTCYSTTPVSQAVRRPVR